MAENLVANKDLGAQILRWVDLKDIPNCARASKAINKWVQEHWKYRARSIFRDPTLAADALQRVTRMHLSEMNPLLRREDLCCVRLGGRALGIAVRRTRTCEVIAAHGRGGWARYDVMLQTLVKSYLCAEDEQALSAADYLRGEEQYLLLIAKKGQDGAIIARSVKLDGTEVGSVELCKQSELGVAPVKTFGAVGAEKAAVGVLGAVYLIDLTAHTAEKVVLTANATCRSLHLVRDARFGDLLYCEYQLPGDICQLAEIDLASKQLQEPCMGGCHDYTVATWRGRPAVVGVQSEGHLKHYLPRREGGVPLEGTGSIKVGVMGMTDDLRGAHLVSSPDKLILLSTCSVGGLRAIRTKDLIQPEWYPKMIRSDKAINGRFTAPQSVVHVGDEHHGQLVVRDRAGVYALYSHEGMDDGVRRQRMAIRWLQRLGMAALAYGIGRVCWSATVHSHWVLKAASRTFAVGAMGVSVSLIELVRHLRSGEGGGNGRWFAISDRNPHRWPSLHVLW